MTPADIARAAWTALTIAWDAIAHSWITPLVWVLTCLGLWILAGLILDTTGSSR